MRLSKYLARPGQLWEHAEQLMRDAAATDDKARAQELRERAGMLNAEADDLSRGLQRAMSAIEDGAFREDFRMVLARKLH